MDKRKRIIKRVFCVCFCLALLGVSMLVGINAYVKASVKNRILSVEEAANLENMDCILVLGCGVWSDGRPSHMLEDRLRRSMELFEQGAAPKLLMSGDHGREDYDEVDAMKTYAVDAGVASSAVFMDHAGFSTYESMYRAKAVFQTERVVIVSQGYHLYRAIYIADRLGLEAWGVASDYRSYRGELSRQLREMLARVKDFGACVIKPEPTYLGEAIPIWGDGDLTNDESSDFS
jgi:vancomycin permeability regulator SanA